MKEVDLIFCKDCIYFSRLELKSDVSEDMRYKKSWCMLNKCIRNADDYCSDAYREEDINPT